MTLKYLNIILMLTIMSGCTIEKSSKKVEIINEINEAEKEFKIQLKQSGRKDSIDLFGLRLEQLPDTFYDRTEIRYLRIDCIESNCLKRLSPKISNLKNLETLILSKTSLENLPKEIGFLPKLKTLRVLGGGKLKSLPDEIGNLTNLEVLDVWRNDLDEITKSIRKLKKLHTIYVGENNFSKQYIKELRDALSNVHVEIWR